MTLRTQLSDLAADAPEPGALDLDLLRGRIIRRRRGRLAAAGGAVVATVAAVGTAAATLLPGGDVPAGPPVATPAPVQQAFEAGACGQPVRTLGRAPDAPLELTVDLHEPTKRGLYDTIGTATITNVSDEVVIGTPDIASPSITRDGVTVQEQNDLRALIGVDPIELQPGESLTDDLSPFLTQCDPAPIDPGYLPGAPYPEPVNDRLPPGSYELYVTWTMRESVPGNSAGNPITLYSGPIAFDLE
ncbi:hypothetical protein [Jiangella mangrovi]|uniref:Uncharacterized protein n=1 Tax=Jiangella mangrovi TaxID=1524084 RepID=A0A7W9GVM7_9ACTN|nr:hypothetical protein [Jiangella mangrovi]MBB5790894.1 hypothetical protein [Jiangella mangrovi]